MAEEGLGEYLNSLLQIPRFKHCNKLGQRARACFCSAVIIFFSGHRIRKLKRLVCKYNKYDVSCKINLCHFTKWCWKCAVVSIMRKMFQNGDYVQQS